MESYVKHDPFGVYFKRSRQRQAFLSKPQDVFQRGDDDFGEKPQFLGSSSRVRWLASVPVHDLGAGLGQPVV